MPLHVVHREAVDHPTSQPHIRRADLKQVVLFILVLVAVVTFGIATIHYNLSHVSGRDNLFSMIVDKFSNLSFNSPSATSH